MNKRIWCLFCHNLLSPTSLCTFSFVICFPRFRLALCPPHPVSSCLPSNLCLRCTLTHSFSPTPRLSLSLETLSPRALTVSSSSSLSGDGVDQTHERFVQWRAYSEQAAGVCVWWSTGRHRRGVWGQFAGSGHVGIVLCSKKWTSFSSSNSYQLSIIDKPTLLSIIDWQEGWLINKKSILDW